MMDLGALKLRLRAQERNFQILVILISAILITFIVAPILSIILKAFITEKGISLSNFSLFFSNSYYREAVYSTFLTALFTVFGTAAIGVPLAYIMVRYEFPLKRLFSILILVPMIMPPFVGAIGLYKILGINGAVNLILVNYLNILDKPINFLFGTIELFRLGPYDKFILPYGIVLINTIHLFPLVYLNCAASLANIDPSLEEQAENLGARGFYLFRTVTFPLMRPGLMAGAVLVFIWTFSDLGTALIVHYFKYLPVIVFFKLYEIRAGNPSPVSYVIGVLMIITSFVALYVSRKYVSLKRYVMLFAGGRVIKKILKPRGVKLALVYVGLILLSLIALSPHIGLTLLAFSDKWVFSILPEGYTLRHMNQVLMNSLPYMTNSILYSSVAAFIDIIIGGFVAYVVTRRLAVGGDLLDLVATLPIAVPGVIFGLGYWALFYKVPLLDPLRYTPIILTISYSMRRLPYTVRVSYAGMLQIDEALEEASINLGATRITTFRKITLPLLVMNLFAGGIMAFVNAMIEVSTTFLLVLTARSAPATWFLYFVAFADPRNGLNMASAIGLIFVIIVATALIVVQKILGSRMGTVFRL